MQGAGCRGAVLVHVQVAGQRGSCLCPRSCVSSYATGGAVRRRAPRAGGRKERGCQAAVVLTQWQRAADRRRRWSTTTSGGSRRRRAREVAEEVPGVVDAGLVSAVGIQLRRAGDVDVPLLCVLLLCYPGAGASMIDSSVVDLLRLCGAARQLEGKGAEKKEKVAAARGKEEGYG